MTLTELNIIHNEKTANYKQIYIVDGGFKWIGQPDGSLKPYTVGNPFVVEDDVEYLFLKKQDLLVSGENIKTINGESVLGNGNINTPIGAIMKEIEIDFGTAPYQTSKVFSVSDDQITPDTKIIANKVLKSPSDGRDTDEIFAESLDISCKPLAGRMQLYVKSLVGTISGRYVINYSFSA